MVNRAKKSVQDFWGTSSATRKRKIVARLKETPGPGNAMEYWRTVIQFLAESRFCTGESKSGWKANFDFLIKPDTHLKVMEGQYNNKKPTPKRYTAYESDADYASFLVRASSEDVAEDLLDNNPF